METASAAGAGTVFLPDRRRLEVDFLLADERGIIPIETKSAERVTSTDARSVETFLAEHPNAAHVGLVVYAGDEVVELRRNVWGVPDWYLLGAL